MWEWVTGRDAHGGWTGVSMTCHGAMEALARTLIQAGRPRSGHVVPVTLAQPVHRPPYYLRGIVNRTAVYDGEVIEWI